MTISTSIYRYPTTLPDVALPGLTLGQKIFLNNATLETLFYNKLLRRHMPYHLLFPNISHDVDYYVFSTSLTYHVIS